MLHHIFFYDSMDQLCHLNHLAFSSILFNAYKNKIEFYIEKLSSMYLNPFYSSSKVLVKVLIACILHVKKRYMFTN